MFEAVVALEVYERYVALELFISSAFHLYSGTEQVGIVRESKDCERGWDRLDVADDVNRKKSEGPGFPSLPGLGEIEGVGVVDVAVDCV